MINKITSETEAEIDIKEDGLITVSSSDKEKIEKALTWIKSLVEEPEIGKIYRGKVVSIKDFGAFVNILPGIDGMLHISQLSEKRVEKVTDVIKQDQEIWVKLDQIDDKGRLSLTMKGVKQ
ncbi:polynucleotide phosphorylase/polyadenylase [Chlamydia trachomatis]|nr:polynucleotide phosphorylase/polyadenylase [Chlamydia trachomatis]